MTCFYAPTTGPGYSWGSRARWTERHLSDAKQRDSWDAWRDLQRPEGTLVPMFELHDATGDWGGLDNLVAYWTRPQIVSIIKKHQAYLLVNIGNEVGNDTVGDG